MKNEGFTEKVRLAFIVYLLSHNRPISELLDPQLKDNLDEVYQEIFEGMTFTPVTLGDLIETWKLLIQKIKRDLTDNEKKFILSIKKKAPEWDLFPIEGIKNLPAIQWKLINLYRMSTSKHKQALEKLERVIDS